MAFKTGINGARKGQSVTVDFIISISIFMLLLAIAYSAWNRQVQNIGDTLLQGRAEEAAARGLEALTSSPGYPSNWAALNLTPNDTALLGIGAADAPGVIDPYKLTRLTALFNDSTYSSNTTLKMGLSPFAADARVAYLNGTNISVMGTAPNSSSVVLASGQRLASWNNNTVLVRVRVWQVTPT